MRILHLHFGKDGGAERFFVKLAGALDCRGIEQAAMMRPSRSWRHELPAGMDVVEAVPRLITRPWVAWKLRNLAERLRPNAYLAWMWRAADMLPEKPGPLRVVRLGDYPRETRSLRNADIVVCNTPGIIGRLRGLGWEGRVEVISNFVDMRETAPIPRAVLGIPEGAFLVVAVGRLVELKGYHVLVRAVAALPDVHLCIVGDGEERAPLAALAQELGAASRVYLPGWRADPAPFIAAADVVCLTSRHETLGNVILEGWAASKPVVATKAAGPSWLIRHNENGLLVDIGDVPALIDAFSQLRRSPAQAALLGSAGRREVEARFSEDSVATAYLQLLGETR